MPSAAETYIPLEEKLLQFTKWPSSQNRPSQAGLYLILRVIRAGPAGTHCKMEVTSLGSGISSVREHKLAENKWPRLSSHSTSPSLPQLTWPYWESSSSIWTSVTLRILQARLQQYVNCNFQMFKLDLEKAEEPKIKLPTSAGSSKKQESFRKTSFCFINYAKAFDCVDYNQLWKILKDMGIPDHLTCLLRNLYASQEATVRTGHGTTDWFQIGKGVHQGCILSPLTYM